MKKTLLAAAVALGATAFTAGSAMAEQFVTVLTGGTSGVYYPMGVAISKAYADNIPDVRTSVQSTKASVENLNLVQRGRGELAFALGDSVANGWEGIEEAGFPQKLDKIRGLAAIYPNVIQIVARGDSGIKTLEDLKGKRVSVGAPKSGTELNARKIFEAAGMTYDDFEKTEYLSFGESVELMKNRQLDATLLSAGLGVSAIRDLASTTPVAIVEVPADVVTAIGEPVFISTTVPAGTYEGVTEDVTTAAIRNFLITSSELSDDLVYNMTKELFENRDALLAAHSAAEGFVLETAAEGMPLPLHPGAEKYYKEQGVLQ
jgi:TRAP transporter TAXI family solute receptor